MRFRLILETLTPVAHFDTRTGVDNPTNVRLFMTQPTVRNGRLAYAPHISENALRSVLLRTPLADHLINALGISAGSIPRPVLNLLFSGGNMGSGRAPGDETVLGHAIKRLYPSLDLLGGAVDSFIIPRSRLRLSSWIVADEYTAAIAALFPEVEAHARSRSAYDLIGEETRTRGTGAEADGNQMLYSYEVLAAGAKIAVELTLDPWTSDATAAAVARGITEWDGYIGGQARQGRGRCKIEWLDAAPIPDAYDEHIGENAGAMRDGIVTGTFGTGKVLCSVAA